MSTGKAFWYQLQVAGKPTFKKAIAVERTRKKFKKCKLNLNFSVKCGESNLYISLSKLKDLKEITHALF